MSTTSGETTKHTAEPWQNNYGCIETAHGWIAEFRNACTSTGKADADRAVACVNACAGMSDPEKEIARMREALNITLGYLEHAPENNLHGCQEIISTIRAALSE